MTDFRLLQLHLTTECRYEFPSLLLQNLKAFHFWAQSYVGLLANQLVSVCVTAASAAGRMTISYLQVEVPAVRCVRPISLLL
jgi:hypothetical protein